MNYTDLNNSRLSLSSIYSNKLDALHRLEGQISDALTWEQYNKLVDVRTHNRTAVISQRDMLKVTSSTTILKAHQDAQYIYKQLQGVEAELNDVLIQLEQYNEQAIA